MADQLRNQDDVRADADQVGAVGMPDGVRRDGRFPAVVHQAGVQRELADQLVDRRVLRRPPRRLRNSADVPAPGQNDRSAFQSASAPRADGSTSGISRESPTLPARHDHLAFARGQRHVVQVEDGELGDAQPGVEQQPGDGPVAALHVPGERAVPLSGTRLNRGPVPIAGTALPADQQSTWSRAPAPSGVATQMQLAGKEVPGSKFEKQSNNLEPPYGIEP